MAKTVAKSPKLPGTWSLFTRSLADYRARLWLLVSVVGLVAIPREIINAYFAGGANTGAYVFIASVIMEVALFYTIIRIHRDNDIFGLRTAYYTSSHALVRFVLVMLGLWVMLLPFGLGTVVYLTVISSAGAAPAGEQLLLGLIGLLISAPSAWLLARYGFGLFAVVEHEYRPFTALRSSWEATRGRFWAILGRVINLVLLLIALSIIPLLVFVFLYALTKVSLFVLLLLILLWVTLLPIALLYLFHLYEALHD